MINALNNDTDRSKDTIEKGNANELRNIKTILVVDDDYLSQEVLLLLLQQQGFRVISASSAFDALDLIAVHIGEIDLILSDIMMPGMGGFDFVEHVKHKHKINIPYIFQTGALNQPDVYQKVQEMKATTLQKPFGREELFLTIQSMDNALCAEEVVA